ncbi:hypothetical protein LWI29_029570 [Acer saccharum]|uniref:Reverse transcriptase domain-containing protein n=1 Tax=Acer saccharum TaxID=4024 RepID=A0AA39VX96_ACESA|nr:hypothetical protein LWI29_029570 [Acer saccharum]
MYSRGVMKICTDRHKSDFTLPVHQSRVPTSSAKKVTVQLRKKHSYQEGGRKIALCGIDKGSQIPGMGGQCSVGQKEKQSMENIRVILLQGNAVRVENRWGDISELVNRIFARQIGRNMEVYVDDMLTKSVTVEKHSEDLKETFDVLRKYKMKLNPSKCVFGVPSGRFLGFQVHQRIKVNPEKIKALEEMASPKTLKDVQRLTGCLA